MKLTRTLDDIGASLAAIKAQAAERSSDAEDALAAINFAACKHAEAMQAVRRLAFYAAFLLGLSALATIARQLRE